MKKKTFYLFERQMPRDKYPYLVLEIFGPFSKPSLSALCHQSYWLLWQNMNLRVLIEQSPNSN